MLSINLPQWHFTQVCEQYDSEGLKSNKLQKGAIKLTLKVAQEMDRENAAVSWLKDGCPEQVR